MRYDKASGLFADSSKVHHLDFAGEFFRVRGPLNVPRPPQGHPVLVQAGSSEAGKNPPPPGQICILCLSNLSLRGCYREEMNQRLRSHGRDPAHFKIIAGVLPVVVNSKRGKGGTPAA